MDSQFDITKIKDFGSYAPHLLRIKTNIPDLDNPLLSTERIIPFQFNEAQLKLHRLWEHLLKTVGFVRIIILKARREGMSTYVEGRVFHKVHTSPNSHTFIIAHDKDGTNTIFDMSKLFYEALPKKYKPMKRYSSKKELVFENPDERTRFANPGLRSKIEVFTANKLGASRSGGYSGAHFSEVALYPDAENLIAGTAPTIPDIPGSFIVYESTAFGRGGFFHDEWIRATSKKKRKETNFIPIFFSWLEFRSYTKPFNDGCTERGFMSSLDPEEKELHKKYKATPLQLHWRRHKILDLGDDIDLFHQEYPTTPEEAFISSGQCYFNRRKVQTIIDHCVDPIWVGDIDNNSVTENEEGSLQIWEKPEKGCEYMLGIDVGGGTDDGDPSVIEVVKVPKGVPILEQVAEYRLWCDPVVLAGKAISLGQYYNEGMLCPEINNHGLTTLNEIKNHYYNIYRWQYFDRYGKQITNKLGWECCTPDSEILTADLRWIKAGDVKVADSLIGFEENIVPSRTTPSRRLCNQTVLGIKHFNASLIKITLSDGNFTVVSNNHPFLIKTYNDSWLEAKDVSVGTRIKYIPKWKIDRSYEAGRLSGLLDGEGHISTGGNQYGLQMHITQVLGQLADEIDCLWGDLGFLAMKKYDRRFDDRHRQELCTMGLNRFSDIILALGRLRPSRLLTKFVDNNFIARNTTRSFGEGLVVAVEEVGEGEVIGIETDGHTLVVDGLMSHNTNIATRALLCDYSSACVNADILVIRSLELAEEMMSFIKRPSTGGEADAGCHDDCVMAFMITIFCLAHSHQANSLLKQLGLFTSPIVTEEKVKMIVTPEDHDFKAFFIPTQSEIEGGRMSWLDY